MPAGAACVYVLLAGLPGSGKSTLAAALSRGLDESGRRAVILGKDEVRQALFPGPYTDYSEAQNELCMRAILKAAGYLCRQTGGPAFVLLDGRTFSQAAHIDSVIQAAETAGAEWKILHLVCPDETARRRLAAASEHPARDRNIELYLRLKTAFEPIAQPHLLLDTSQGIELCVRECLDYVLRAEHEGPQNRVVHLSVQGSRTHYG